MFLITYLFSLFFFYLIHYELKIYLSLSLKDPTDSGGDLPDSNRGNSRRDRVRRRAVHVRV